MDMLTNEIRSFFAASKYVTPVYGYEPEQEKISSRPCLCTRSFIIPPCQPLIPAIKNNTDPAKSGAQII